VIATARLLLRPFSRTDVPKVFAMSGEDGIRRWLPDQTYRDESHAEHVLRALMAHTAQHPDPRTRPYVLGIEDTKTRDLIGHVGLSPARGSVEVGYAIEERYQGRGLATEAVSAVSRWALAELSLAEILGIVVADNVRSCRVLKKASFVRSGEEIKNATRILIYRSAR
jgi:[ribosomal protein S5]-alanine N-acetyltransferase